MSIYNDLEEYAKKTCMTLEEAKTRCEHFKKIQQEMSEAKKCPKCGQRTLEIEGGSYEEGISEFVYCENDRVSITDEDGEECLTDCDFTSVVKKEHAPIYHWYDFDEVLAFSIDFEKDGKENVERHIGCSWREFVEASNKRIILR